MIKNKKEKGELGISECVRHPYPYAKGQETLGWRVFASFRTIMLKAEARKIKVATDCLISQYLQLWRALSVKWNLHFSAICKKISLKIIISIKPLTFPVSLWILYSLSSWILSPKLKWHSFQLQGSTCKMYVSVNLAIILILPGAVDYFVVRHIVTNYLSAV